MPLVSWSLEKSGRGKLHTYIPSHAVLCRPWGTCLCGDRHSVVA
ncbi:rCG31503, isoform CRA_b [Rattus norvegicus]|uniref:RCG31503, isoform CRA_b n=1 Tax=Rattus norvegicus TaxID=10116 RepID=A6IUL9_RAT|nr:rCG31503, isoform CRA_b [Rattus norvegicus]